MTRVLVVDDEPLILRILCLNLRARHYEVRAVLDGGQALRQAVVWQPDLVILDLGLPDLDGVKVIEELRAWSQMPIIVLSGRGGSQDEVDAFNAGADDYVVKPFGMDELIARVRAVIDAPPTVARRQSSRSAHIASTSLARPLLDRDMSRCTSLRSNGESWSRFCAALGHSSGGDNSSPRSGVPATTWTPIICALTWPRCAQTGADPARPRHLITEPGIGYRFEP